MIQYFGVEHCLILTLRSQIFGYLRGIVYRHSLEVHGTGWLGKKTKTQRAFLRKHQTVSGHFFKPVVGRDTFSSLGTSLAPNLTTNWQAHPLPLYIWQYDTKSVALKYIYIHCKRGLYLCLTKLGSFNFNQLALKPHINATSAGWKQCYGALRVSSLPDLPLRL